ncbi:CSS-motif domain-containing protein [Rahnella rivi]|uniref:CSS-motif domain-containing protein n=1 Tax=Rahnella rivi TaxID=2816249 RepID=UPI0039BDF040
MKTAKPFGQPLFILFSTVLVAAITLVMTHFAIAAYDRDDLASYARHIMAPGLEVADESHNIVSNVNSLRLEPCSDRFLDEIRYLSFTSVFISDIGYTQDHQLKCTAMRGRLPEPVTMSVPPLRAAHLDVIQRHCRSAHYRRYDGIQKRAAVPHTGGFS